MTPAEWIDYLETNNMDITSAWRIRQEFADQQDADGLISFFREAQQLHDSEVFQKVEVTDSVPLEEGLRKLFHIAEGRVTDDESIKAIHCEYYFDGDDSNCEANLYLCHDFQEGSDEWLCDWTDSDEISDGPFVYPYLKYEQLGLEPYSIDEYLPRAYGEAVLLASYMRTVKIFKGIRIPCTFGEHDSGYTIIRPVA